MPFLSNGRIAMNYLAYYDVDVINGPGTRCTLFVSGCEHACKGCFQQRSWPTNAGFLFTKELEDKIISDLNDTRIKRSGLSLSGGDPLHPHNHDGVLNLVKRVRNEVHNANIWLWSGYVFENINNSQKEIIQLIDVMVDGKFEKKLADPSLLFRGSSNQRIINVKEQISLK